MSVFLAKKSETVLSQYKKAFSPCDFDSFFFKEYRESDKIVIIATPDGHNEAETLAEYTPEEFFVKIA